MKVEELMIRNVETCRLDENLAVAAGKMWDHDIGCLPVLGRQGHLIGIVTDRDICMAGYLQGRPLAEIPVAVAVSRPLYTCRADDALVEAAEIMRNQQVRRLPVLGVHGGLVGIISLNDLARAVERQSGRGRRQLTAEEVNATFAVVSEPRASHELTAQA